jgi:hypothetical protein
MAPLRRARAERLSVEPQGQPTLALIFARSSSLEEYNVSSKHIEQLFLELLELSHTFTHEEARQAREQLKEEELVVFDLLTRPGTDLSTEERN